MALKLVVKWVTWKGEGLVKQQILSNFYRSTRCQLKSVRCIDATTRMCQIFTFGPEHVLGVSEVGLSELDREGNKEVVLDQELC